MMPGGAGNVACNIRGLGANVLSVSVLRKDIASHAARSMLDRFGAGSEAMLAVDPARPTTQRSRYMSDRYESHLLRADRGSTRSIADIVAHAVAISDDANGVVRPRLRARVIAEGVRLG